MTDRGGAAAAGARRAATFGGGPGRVRALEGLPREGLGRFSHPSESRARVWVVWVVRSSWCAPEQPGRWERGVVAWPDGQDADALVLRPLTFVSAGSPSKAEYGALALRHPLHDQLWNKGSKPCAGVVDALGINTKDF